MNAEFQLLTVLPGGAHVHGQNVLCRSSTQVMKKYPVACGPAIDAGQGVDVYAGVVEHMHAPASCPAASSERVQHDIVDSVDILPGSIEMICFCFE